MAVKEDYMSIDQVLTEIRHHEAALQALQKALITRARLQAWSEEQYNELVELVKEGTDLFSELQIGDVLTEPWIARRDELIERARRFTLDA